MGEVQRHKETGHKTGKMAEKYRNGSEKKMTEEQRAWARAREELVEAVVQLGFPEALGNEIAKNLGSEKAMRRMTAYLWYVKPKSAEILVDEMLAIRSDITAWREKKESEEASARYYQMRRQGFTDREE